MASKSVIYLIPSVLFESAIHTIPAYVIEAVKDCQVIFAENERTVRRYLKSIWKEIIIDELEWFAIHKAEEGQVLAFQQKIKEEKNIAIVSEAGCPGIADPGQLLVHTAQQMDITVKPLVGPNSILLALMASGLNGQQFQFAGYLPIEIMERKNKIKELEDESSKKHCTQIFIETPYRNNQIIEEVLKTCKAGTQFCIAADLTSTREFIKTKSIEHWRKEKIDMHKRPAIFLLLA